MSTNESKEELGIYNSLLDAFAETHRMLDNDIDINSWYPVNTRTDVAVNELKKSAEQRKIPADVCIELSILLTSINHQCDSYFTENVHTKDLLSKYKTRNNRLWNAVAILAAILITMIIYTFFII